MIVRFNEIKTIHINLHNDQTGLLVPLVIKSPTETETLHTEQFNSLN